MRYEVTDETIAKIIIKECNELLKKKDETDFNDVLHYIKLLKANFEGIKEVMNANKKENNKFFNKYHQLIGFNQDVHSYWYDGNGTKRIHKTTNKYNHVEYTHKTLEEVLKETEEIKAEMQKLLPVRNDDFVEIDMTKEDLEDYNEKCYKTKNMIFIPKSVVGFTEDNKVVLKEWFYKKNKFMFEGWLK